VCRGHRGYFKRIIARPARDRGGLPGHGSGARGSR
jgi:hypothetical protein